MIVLDTNVVSEPLRVAADPRVIAWLDKLDDSEAWLTTITAAELRAGVEKLPAGKRRDALDAQITAILEDEFGDRILPFGLEAAYHYGMIVGPKLRGEPPRKVMDLQIAAIARANGAALATRNSRDFDGCGVDLVNPWDG